MRGDSEWSRTFVQSWGYGQCVWEKKNGREGKGVAVTLEL